MKTMNIDMFFIGENNMEGKLIVVEGACDGIGKSTQYELLKSWLKSEGYEIECHHFPSYGKASAAPVERFLKGELGDPSELSPYFINSLYAVDRAITWNEKLKPAYESGRIITLDRYTTSSLIYQSALFESNEDKEKFIKYVTDFEYSKMCIKKPDLVIFLYAPFDIITKFREARIDNEGIKKDVFERDLGLQKKVYDTGLFVFELLGWDRIVCSDDEEMKKIEDIHEEVKSLVRKKVL